MSSDRNADVDEGASKLIKGVKLSHMDDREIVNIEIYYSPCISYVKVYSDVISKNKR